MATRGTRSKAGDAEKAKEKAKGGNPLEFLGLKRVDEEDGENSRSPPKGMELNRRGLPARKRKRNSLIFGDDDDSPYPPWSPAKSTGSGGGRSSAKSSPVKMRSGAGRKAAAAASEPKEPKEKKKENAVPAAVTTVASPAAAEEAANDEEIEDMEAEEKAAAVATETKTSRRRAATATRSAPSTPAPAFKSPPPSPRKTQAPRASTSSSATQSPKSSPIKKTRSVTLGTKRTRTSARAISGKSAASMDDLELTTPEKKSAQLLGVALRNLLKLPKAHKWVCYEFFYSNIDKVLFGGETDFMVCLRESFPLLKTRRLTRVEWCKIRRLMGKPRRCSQAFFAEERMELARKRQKIRLLQQRKQRTEDLASFKDLPDDIPIQLTIGARVTARLRKPQDGLFTGTVDAYDTSNSTYRITFDRSGLGTHSIPDFEVLSTADPETVPLSTFTNRPKPRPIPIKEEKSSITPQSYLSPVKYGLYSPGLSNDPLLSGSTPKGKVMRMDGNIGGYPVRFLEQIVRLSKCLKLKRERVTTLKELNGMGERKKSFGEYITEDFQRKYAATVLELSQLNRDLDEHLMNIKEFTQQFSSEAGPTISLPNIIREGCQEDAYNMVNKNNSLGGAATPPEDGQKREHVENPKTLTLISSLTALMLQVKQLADGERSAFELQALQDSISEIKQNLRAENVSKFEDNVEVHMHHIRSGLSHMGNLHAFMRPQQQPQQPPSNHALPPALKLEPF